MGLPDLIEILPLEEAVHARVTVPGSKSITNRALLLAALGTGETRLQGALWSEDTQVMVDALRTLGFQVSVGLDTEEACNRNITVNGLGGRIPNSGTPARPLDLFVGNAGTAARFLAAFVCLGNGTYRLHGVPRMHERPQAALFSALRQLGYRVESSNDRMPALVHGTGPRNAKCTVSIEDSSQFASGLLLCAKAGLWEVEIIGENADESPYVGLTTKLAALMNGHGGKFFVEPDASSGSYFWGANQFDLLSNEASKPKSEIGLSSPQFVEWSVQVKNWPKSGWQIDAQFPQFMSVLRTTEGSTSADSVAISRQRDLGDSIMTMIALAPLAKRVLKFTDLGRLRLQESERVLALRTELTRCGGKVIENVDTLEVHPTVLHGEEIETYDDHRMAMCFAILGLKIQGIKLKNPSCVKKTFPNFFQKLAAEPPEGLGATILEAKTGSKLNIEELFAD